MARVPTAEKFEIAKIIRQSLWNLCWTRPNHTVIVMSSSSKCFLSHLDAKSTFSNSYRLKSIFKFFLTSVIWTWLEDCPLSFLFHLEGTALHKK